MYCWHPVTRIAEELGWQPEQSSIRKLILFVNISAAAAAACSRTRSRCQCGTRGQRQSTILHSNSKVEIFGYGWYSMQEDIGRRLKRTFIALCPLCVHQLCCHWNAIQFLANHDQWSLTNTWICGHWLGPDKNGLNFPSIEEVFLLKAGQNTQLSSSLLSYMRGWSVTR